MTANGKPDESARYVRISGVITAGEGLDMEIEELEVLIGSVHDLLDKLGFHIMLNWDIVHGGGSWRIATTGPRFEGRQD